MDLFFPPPLSVSYMFSSPRGGARVFASLLFSGQTLVPRSGSSSRLCSFFVSLCLLFFFPNLAARSSEHDSFVFPFLKSPHFFAVRIFSLVQSNHVAFSFSPLLPTSRSLCRDRDWSFRPLPSPPFAWLRRHLGIVQISFCSILEIFCTPTSSGSE